MEPSILTDGWRHKGRMHLLRLTVIRPKPILFRVEHRIVGADDHEVHRTLFNDQALAEKFFHELRSEPPDTYMKEFRD